MLHLFGGGSPLSTKSNGHIIEGFGNTFPLLKPRESSADVTANSPTSNIDGVLSRSGNNGFAFIEDVFEEKSGISDDLLSNRNVTGWVPFGTLTETNSTNYPAGYPASVAGTTKTIKLETEAIGVGNATGAYQYTLNTAVSTTGQTDSRCKIVCLARAVANNLGVVEKPSILLSVINGAVASNVIADDTSGKEVYGHYATRLDDRWKIIEFYADVDPIPATLKFRISVREQNRSAGTAAMEIYFPEPFFTFNPAYEDGHLFRAPVHRTTVIDANGSATLDSDGAQVIKLTGVPTTTVVTAITSKWNSYVTVLNATASNFTILGVAVNAGTTTTWFKDDTSTFYTV